MKVNDSEPIKYYSTHNYKIGIFSVIIIQLKSKTKTFKAIILSNKTHLALFILIFIGLSVQCLVIFRIYRFEMVEIVSVAFHFHFMNPHAL